jgi:hypothetical protein
MIKENLPLTTLGLDVTNENPQARGRFFLQRYAHEGLRVEFLDGDELRRTISNELVKIRIIRTYDVS